ncbi:MAG: hypothetical protein J0H46_15145 [Bacteroidetes bacterium]|nr:hypothetical protein [Bacteroidota bacterium]
MRKLFFSMCCVSFFNLHAQRIIVNGWKYSATASPTLPATNLWAYYEADDASSITQSSNNVSQWNDKSGNGRNWLQSNATLKPVWNGTNAITFQGSSGQAMYQSASLSQPYTIYIVAAVNIIANSDGAIMFYDNGATNSFMDVERASSTNTFKIYANTGTLSLASLHPVNSTYYLFKGSWNGSSSSLSVNTSSVIGSVGTATASSPIGIGYIGTNTSSLSIKGIYIYQGGTPNDAAVRAYTTNKWGIP